MGQRVRRVLVAVVAAAVVVGVTAALASGGASASRPAITFVSPSPAENAMVTSSSITFSFAYNRTPKQTGTLSCTLSGPTSSSGGCDAPVASGSKDSQSGKSYSGLASGSYTFTVALTLTDGGTASAIRHFSVSVNAGHIYWTNNDTNTIALTWTAPVRTRASSLPVCRTGWPSTATTFTGRTLAPSCRPPSPGSIGRANLDGTSPNQSFISSVDGPVGVAVDGTHIYWANFSTDSIGRANLDGSSPDQSFITGASDPVAVAVDGNHIYWANNGTSSIGRANLDGTSPNPNFITVLFSPTGVAVDGNHVYWSEAVFRTIGRANLDGTSPNQNFITGASSPRGLAVGSG
jgi:Low-density lipoprotein receptor repeat class B